MQKPSSKLTRKQVKTLFFPVSNCCFGNINLCAGVVAQNLPFSALLRYPSLPSAQSLGSPCAAEAAGPSLQRLTS